MGIKTIALMAAAPLTAASLLVVPGADAKTFSRQDERCTAEPVVVSEKSATDLLPTARRLVITQASCSEASESESAPLDIVVRVRPIGDRQYVAAIVRAAMIQRSGGGETIREAVLDGVPVGPPGSEICVEINGDEDGDEERCIGGQ